MLKILDPYEILAKDWMMAIYLSILVSKRRSLLFFFFNRFPVRFYTTSMKGVERCVNDIIKSAEDKRLYRCLELQNDMKVLLISDSSTDKSSASLDVNVGK